MARIPTGFFRPLTALAPPDLAFFAYEDPEEPIPVLTALVEAGLRRGACCLLSVESEVGDAVCERLIRRGVDVDAELDRGRLEWIAPEAIRLRLEIMDPQDMAGYIKNVRERRLRRFPALYVLADMSCPARFDLDKTQCLTRAVLQALACRHPRPEPVSVCNLFDERLFPRAFLEEVLAFYPYVILN